MEEKTMWFEPGFNKDVQQFILTNPLPQASLDDSFTESFRYAERFIDARFSFALCEGNYLGDDEPDEHYWLRIRGRIFDPTSARFRSTPCSAYYDCLVIWDVAKIEERLPMLHAPKTLLDTMSKRRGRGGFAMNAKYASLSFIFVLLRAEGSQNP
jgi:hypothetical protein